MEAEKYLLEQLKKRELFNCNTDDCYQVLAEIMEDYAKDKWIVAKDLPKEICFYLCYLIELNDLGTSRYQDLVWFNGEKFDNNSVVKYTPLLASPND